MIKPDRYWCYYQGDKLVVIKTERGETHVTPQGVALLATSLEEAKEKAKRILNK